MELSASRLLEPAFGNNQLVWAALIGLILAYLAIGAWVGGQLADRFPSLGALQMTALISAIGVAAIPFVSPHVLQLAALGIENFALGILLGSLVAVLLLFSIPGILLGAIGPWAVRLAVHDIAQSGKTAGKLYATATVGSILGTFFPVLWFIPAYGTRWSFAILALSLLIVVALTSLGSKQMWLALLTSILLVVMTLVNHTFDDIRTGWDDGSAGEIIYEDESRFNYIVVRQWGSERHLKLNDGVGIHSVYHPDTVLSLGIWDYFLLAPLFRDHARSDLLNLDHMLLIGLAAGTTSGLMTEIYGSLPITGIELDPQIIEIGRQFFDMDQPNLTPISADGRAWLAQQDDDAKWDYVAVDAYRPPYIPFHLTTVEFFTLVRQHLTQNGVLAINIGRTATNFELVDRLAATVLMVFPSVYVIDEPGPAHDLGNSLLVATVRETSIENFSVNLARLPSTVHPDMLVFAQQAQQWVRVAATRETTLPFTDDKAPVEQVVHQIIFDYMFKN